MLQRIILKIHKTIHMKRICEAEKNWNFRLIVSVQIYGGDDASCNESTSDKCSNELENCACLWAKLNNMQNARIYHARLTRNGSVEHTKFIK